MAFEGLEQRTLLAADVAAETVAILPQERLPGDANQDGLFGQSDLMQVLQAGKYLTGEQAEWSEGDWNGDGVFDQSDLTEALQMGKYSRGADGGVDSHVFAAKAHGRAELPHRNWGDSTIVFDFDSATLDGPLLTVPLTMTGSGIATQTGRYENAGTGTMIFDVSSGTPTPVLMEGSGCATITATGDEIHWVAEAIGTSQHVTVTFTHGTGRFEDVEGGFTYDYTPDPGNPPNVLSYDYVGRGTITF
jgi:hypothetical protein